MAKRDAIGASTRWSIFARDGFTCRYCGAMAGSDGVELAIDHVVSVAEGGTNHPDNLVTACRRCNGGKHARSLRSVPTPQDVVDRVRNMAANVQEQVEAAREAIAAKKELDQQMVNIKCEAYGVDSVSMQKNEYTTMRYLVSEFGADMVLDWYTQAASRSVTQWQAVRYVCGIARKVRESAGA